MAGGIAAYNYSFMRTSLTIIAGGMSDDADKTYLAARNGLKKLENTQFRKDSRGNNNNEFVHANTFGSEIRTVSCKDNNQALNRFSPFFVIYEEGGKWKKGLLLETSSFTEAATKAEGIKTGYKLYIGTGGSMDMGAADLETLHYAPDKRNTLQFNNIFESEENLSVNKTGWFTAAWWYRKIDKDGNSLKAESIEDIKREEAESDPNQRITFRTQNPIYASEAFMVPAGGFFGENVVQMLNERKAYIKTHKEAQTAIKGRLDWIDPKKPLEKGVKFTQDEELEIYLSEEPLRDRTETYHHHKPVRTLMIDEALTSNSMAL